MDYDGPACEVCKGVDDIGMMPNAERIVCGGCASDAQNELIVRAKNKIGTDSWHGPVVELSSILTDMRERVA